MSNNFSLIDSKCLFCAAGIEATETTEDSGHIGTIIAGCPHCGKYTFDSREMGQSKKYDFSESEKIALRGLVRNYFDEKNIPFPKFDLKEAKRLANSSGTPADVSEQVTHFLFLLSKITKYLGTKTKSEHIEIWSRRAYLPSGDHFKEFAEELGGRGLIHQQFMSEDKTIIIKLTMSGWEEVRKIKSKRGDGNQAFVAMWFHREMNAIFDEGFFPALKSVGYHPYRVDREPHQNRIDDEIMAQIRRSRVLVCDVTGERGGVYFEAGFALGLGIPVIWCCNQTWEVRLQKNLHPSEIRAMEFEECKWTDRRHFDTAHFPHIFWKDTVDLQKQLTLRIQALGLDLNNQ